MGVDKAITITFLIIALAFVGLLLAIFGSRVKEGISAKSMYNIAGCLVIASIISCAISFFAIVLALEKGNTNNIYQQDVIVDIFAVLVTVLMGWNIISVVDIKKEAGKIGRISKDLEIVISGILRLSIHSFTLREEKEAVIDNCLSSLESICLCEDKTIMSSALSEIMDVLYHVINSYKEDENITIYDRKEKYKFILRHTDHLYTDQILESIEKAGITAKESTSIKFADSKENDVSATTGYDYNSNPTQ